MTVDRQTAALAISVAALVPAVYGAALPSLADVRSSWDERGHLAAAENYAGLTALFLVVGVGFATREPAVLAVGGLALFAFHLSYTRARQTIPG